MKRLMLIVAVCLAVAGVAVITGCGGSSTESATPTAAESQDATGQQGSAGGATVAVAMKDTAFSPADVEVSVGDTVEWTNDDAFDHNVVADSGADFKSSDFGEGDTFQWKAAKPGSVTYECTIHPGMTGTITVK